MSSADESSYRLQDGLQPFFENALDNSDVGLPMNLQVPAVVFDPAFDPSLLTAAAAPHAIFAAVPATIVDQNGNVVRRAQAEGLMWLLDSPMQAQTQSQTNTFQAPPSHAAYTANSEFGAESTSTPVAQNSRPKRARAIDPQGMSNVELAKLLHERLNQQQSEPSPRSTGSERKKRTGSRGGKFGDRARRLGMEMEVHQALPESEGQGLVSE